ncbi:GH23776 [Drosophila grimshawi]|uniref:GH23776 n=1 Tax=Drosophila grimshawi TaxID=7222 RepID=B4K231_DROGR|nr:GH23776 [Drosophila grimshawi]
MTITSGSASGRVNGVNGMVSSSSGLTTGSGVHRFLSASSSSSDDTTTDASSPSAPGSSAQVPCEASEMPSLGSASSADVHESVRGRGLANCTAV